MSDVLIRWRDEFALGIPEVDHEHRELIELINEIYAGLSDPAEETTLADFLGELFADISSHFALEERTMRERGYDAYLEHKAEHERLLDEIRDLMDIVESGEAPELDAFAGSLEEWFSGHFRTHDARLHHRLG